METAILPVKEMNVFRLGEICFALVPLVFETLGETPSEPIAEISEILNEMPVDTSARQLRRFRDGEFSCQILQHFRHSDNSVGSEHYFVDFQITIERSDRTLLRLTAAARGHSSRCDYWHTILIFVLKAECADERWKNFAEIFVQKINEFADKDCKHFENEALGR